jgi:tryptophan-rich sensory protein
LTQGGILRENAHFEVVGQNMTWLDWYNSLSKPGWPPVPGTIGLVWHILYPIILISFGFVFVQAIWKHYHCVAMAQVPYFIWVSLARVLQLSITMSNWGR